MADQNSQYMAILTAVGEARLANAQALGIAWHITQLGVGDANGAEPMPDRLQTALISERRRKPLNQLKIDPNNASIIIAEQVIPEDEGGWWIREIGLYDESGDLVAVANCPPTFKPQLAQGSGRTQVVRLNLLVSSTQNIQLKIDPSVVLATRSYVDTIIAGHLAAADPHPQYQLRGATTALAANTQLTASHEGLLLLSAAAGNRTFTLPAANAALGVRELVLRRTDATANALVIAASGTDKIMLDTAAAAAGVSTTELLFSGDYLRLRSDKAGKWWCVGQSDLPGSIATGLVVFTVSSTFNVPPVLRSGRRIPKVTVVGAGAGGGHHSDVTTRQNTAGGGAGGTAIKRQSLVGVTSVPVTVGLGGAGGSNSTGSDGETSSFGTYCSATGGGGTTSTPGSGGRGGVGVGGDINVNGGGGHAPTPILSTTSSLSLSGQWGGDGGASYMGGGSRGGFSVGGSGAPGAGGGGNTTASPGVTGLNGANGIVMVEW